MKFELDTNAKTVKLLEEATLGQINEVMKRVLGEEADQFRIITNVTYNPIFVTQPVVIRPTRYWWESPIWKEYTTGGRFEITCSSNTDVMSVTAMQ